MVSSFWLLKGSVLQLPLFACGRETPYKIVRPDTINLLVVVRIVGINIRIVTQDLSPSPGVSPSWRGFVTVPTNEL